MKRKIIVILGPTAVGKTALSLEIAQQFKGEIISGDSQQVYRQLDIGTAKVSQAERELISHHLIDVREVTESYSAYDFVTEAKSAISEIASRGNLPMIVGGTGLYLQSLLEGYHLGGKVPHDEIQTFRAVLEQFPTEMLFEKVAEEGLVISQINRRRAIRALEIKKFGSDLINEDSELEPLIVGLNMPRERLYERINQRVDQMVEEGLLEEAEWLYRYYPDAQATRGIGYKEWFPYFSGDATKEDAIEKVKQHTRQFAKRQLTWFKNRMRVDFYDVSTPAVHTQILHRVEEFLDD